MKHLLAKIKELETREFDVVTSRGALAIHQTQRNKAKAELIEALHLDLKEVFEEEGYKVYQTASGPILEILNENVDEQISKSGEDSDFYSGMISIQFDAIMKNLETDGSLEEQNFLQDLAVKREKEALREASKLKKIQKDAEARAEKARKREEEILKLQAIRQAESED